MIILINSNIYFQVKKEINREFKKAKLADNLCSYFPKTKEEVYAVPGCGIHYYLEHGEETVNKLINIKNKYALKDLSKKECFIEYRSFYESLVNINPIADGTIGDFCKYINESVDKRNIDFELNTKMIVLYLYDSKLIEMNFNVPSDTPYKLTPAGISYGFIIITKEKNNGDKYQKLGFNNEEASKFLINHLGKIFYLYYGINRLNQIKKNINYDSLEEGYFIILDADATIFDTDFLREKRQIKGINSIDIYDYNKIKLIKGFNETFTNINSPFNLFTNKAVIITNSSNHYISNILKLYNVIFNDIKYLSNTRRNKIALLKELKNIIHNKKIIAFGDDEKDALIYAEVDVPYYIVNNYYGYESINKILSKINNSSNFKFRKKFMYDVIDIKNDKIRGFNSRYFDDIVVYYKRYYDKRSNNGNCPLMTNRIMEEKLNFSNFGYNKKEYILNNIKDIIKTDLSGIYVPSDAIIAKVPGSKETSVSYDSPTSYLINGLSKINNNYNTYYDLLLRTSIVSQNHGMLYFGEHSDRTIDKHLRTIYVNPKYNIKGKTIYLYDDIVTSGASMMACVEKLYEAGAGHVICFCLARTCPFGKYKLYDVEGGER